MVNIENTGVGTTTTAVDGLQIDFVTAAVGGTVDNAGIRIDMDPAGATEGTDTVEAIDIANISNPTGLTTGVRVGNGYDVGIAFMDSGGQYAGLKANADVTTSYTWSLPAADAAGCLKSDGVGAISIAACGDVKTQTYSSNGNAGTFNKTSDALLVIVETIGGGGSGGGGSQGNVGQIPGGGGGGGGAYMIGTYDAAGLAASVKVNVGNGGAATAQFVDGNTGTDSCIADTIDCAGVVYQIAYGGGGGSAPTNNTVNSGGGGGGGGGSSTRGNNAAAANLVGGTGGTGGGNPAAVSVSGNDVFSGGGGATTTGGGVQGGNAGFAGGGGGGGSQNGNAAANVGRGGNSARGGAGGGGGGTSNNTAASGGTNSAGHVGGTAAGGKLAGGSAGTAGGGSGGVGGSAANASYGGAGGGGGGSNVASAGVGGGGGAGGNPGGGGGGGGTALNNTAGTGGTGGAGANGQVKIWTLRGAGADLAEIYATNDPLLQSGDVVAIDPELHAGVKKSERAYDPNAIGVISTEPGMVLGNTEEDPGKRPVIVALAGRVPVKVSLENGPINPGDELTPSSVAGVAMRATKAGLIIGQALTKYDGTSFDMGDAAVPTGYIVMFIKNSHANGATLAQILPGLNVDTGPPSGTDSAQFTPVIASDLTIGKQALAYFLATKQELAKSVNFSEILADRISAALEVITPKVLTDELVANSLEPYENDFTVKLGADGKFIIGAKGEATGSATPVITFDRLGNAEFAGTITAHRIRASQIEGLTVLAQAVFADQFGALADASASAVLGMASSSATLAFDGSTLDTLTRLGALTVTGEATFQAKTIFQALAEFLGDIIFRGRVTFNNDTAGIAVIPKSTTFVDVVFERPYEAAPIVTISLVLEEATDSSFLTEAARAAVANVTEKGFAIVLNEPVPRDLQYNWVAISVTDAKRIVGKALEEPSPTLTPTATPVPTPTVEPTVIPTATPEPSASP